MPRRLLRDGRVLEDDGRYAAEAAAVSAAPGPAGYLGPLILNFDEWQLVREQHLFDHQRASLRTGRQRLGVVLWPALRVEQLATDLARLDLIALQFTGPSEGRGYSQARQLRERWQFSGELRAMGFVRRDQLFFMARCGFNSFELPDGDLEHAAAAFATFSAAYQPSNDAGLGARLPSRLHDMPVS